MTYINRIKDAPNFDKKDIFILGLPVYGGRIPEVVEEYIYSLKSEGTNAIIVAVYGNRDYYDALVEMRNILSENGFSVIAAGAFIGEHSFSKNLATDRPDTKDLAIAREFGKSIAEKISKIGDEKVDSIIVKGNYPYKERGPMPPVTPSTNENCTECMICVYDCPTNAIDSRNPRKIDANKCILCCECIKICPEEAKSNESEAILGIVAMLEENFTERKEPELFI